MDTAIQTYKLYNLFFYLNKIGKNIFIFDKVNININIFFWCVFVDGLINI